MLNDMLLTSFSSEDLPPSFINFFLQIFGGRNQIVICIEFSIVWGL